MPILILNNMQQRLNEQIDLNGLISQVRKLKTRKIPLFKVTGYKIAQIKLKPRILSSEL